MGEQLAFEHLGRTPTGLGGGPVLVVRGATLVVVPEARMQVQADTGPPDVVRRPSRLRALAALEANAESSAQALDRIAGIACRVLEAPVVLVNLVGADRQRFVGCGGPDQSWVSVREMPLTHGFCPFALGAEDAYAFADARANPTLAANPVVEQLGVVAYAGVPLRVAGGEPIGTLCAIDHKPHAWSEDDLATLSDLAASAVAELQLLAATRQAVRHQSRVRALAALSSALAPAASARDVVDRLAPVVDRMDAGAVWLLVLDESGQALRTAAAAGADPEAIARHDHVPLDAQPPLAEVVGTGQPDFLATRSDVRDRFAPMLEVDPNAGSVALLPLVAGELCRGVLAVCFADERALSTEDHGYLAALAGIVSLALTRVG
jgi:GAF domain-containing protein